MKKRTVKDFIALYAPEDEEKLVLIQDGVSADKTFLDTYWAAHTHALAMADAQTGQVISGRCYLSWPLTDKERDAGDYPDIFRQLVQLLQSQIHPLERKIFPQIRPQGLHPSEFRHIEAVHSQKLSGALQLLKGRRQSDLRCFALYTNRAGVFHPYPENAVQSLVLQKFRCLFLHIIAAGIFSSMLFPIFSPHTGIIDIGLEAIRKWYDPFVHKVDAQF